MLSYTRQLHQTQGIVAAKFYPGLNGTKGLLILMVVFTHCLPPSMMLYFLYFCHMPLFMAISGFLLKESAFQSGYKAYIIRMWHRLLMPWLIASLIFIPFRLTGGGPDAQMRFTDIIYPYYHLWYIPSYLIGATICYVMVKKKISVWTVLLAFALITTAWYNIYRDTPTPVTQLPLYYMGDKRLFAYLFFFILAFGLRNGLVQVRITPFALLVMKVIALVSLAFLVLKNFSSLYVVWPYLIFNTCLVLFILVYVAPQKVLQNKLFMLANEQSLGIYLYHPLILTIIYIVLNDRIHRHINNLEALGIFAVAISGTLGLILMLKRWSVTDKYMLGNIKR